MDWMAKLLLSIEQIPFLFESTLCLKLIAKDDFTKVFFR